MQAANMGEAPSLILRDLGPLHAKHNSASRSPDATSFTCLSVSQGTRMKTKCRVSDGEQLDADLTRRYLDSKGGGE